MLWYFNDEGNAVIIKPEPIIRSIVFGKHAWNYKESIVNAYLTEYYHSTIMHHFRDNIIPHVVDLVSLSGANNGDYITTEVSAPTFDQYRSHRKILEDTKLIKSYYWWLATPWMANSEFLCNGLRALCVGVGGSVLLVHPITDDFIGIVPCFVVKKETDVYIEKQ